MSYHTHRRACRSPASRYCPSCHRYGAHVDGCPEDDFGADDAADAEIPTGYGDDAMDVPEPMDDATLDVFEQEDEDEDENDGAVLRAADDFTDDPVWARWYARRRNRDAY